MRSLIFRSFLILVLLASTGRVQAGRDDKAVLALLLQKMNKAYTDHSDSLLHYIAAAEMLAQKLNDDDALLNTYKIKGNYYFLNSDYTQALAIYSKGIRLGEDHHPGEGLVTLYYEIAGVYSKSGNKGLVLQNILKGLRLAEKINFTTGLADGNNRLGVTFERAGQLDSALICFKKSYELYAQVNDSIGMSYSLENQATSYGLQKKPDEAIKYMKLSLKLREIKNDKYGIAIANINISEIYLQKEMTDSAIKYARIAERAARDVHFFDLLQYTYKHLYLLYKKEKKPELALFYFEQHAKLNDSVFNTAKNRQIAEFSTKFDTERKEQQIKALSKQRTIQRLGLFVMFLLLGILFVVVYFVFKNRKLKEGKLKAEAAFRLQLQETEARTALQNERLRISRELHDNIGAHLTFINATVDSMDKDGHKMQQVKELTNETIRELRKTVWLINKATVKVDEFVVKLRDFFKNIPMLAVQAEVSDPEVILKAELITELFRATQESVNNAVKYSGASEIIVTIRSGVKRISILIEDNGCGFDVKEQVAKGFGLENMQHRMNSINGSYRIFSEKGKGTAVSLNADFS